MAGLISGSVYNISPEISLELHMYVPLIVGFAMIENVPQRFWRRDQGKTFTGFRQDPRVLAYKTSH